MSINTFSVPRHPNRNQAHASNVSIENRVVLTPILITTLQYNIIIMKLNIVSAAVGMKEFNRLIF